MMKRSLFLIPLLCILVVCCEQENIEEKYFNPSPGDTLGNPTDSGGIPGNQPRGEIAWFPLNGNLKDSTGNNTTAVLIGDTNFVNGINDDHGKGIHLGGTSYLLINLGYYDTLSIVLWLKSDQEISSPNEPAIFDYGLNTISSFLTDGSTGATTMHVKKNGSIRSSEEAQVEYLNSFNRYSFLYFEAGGDLTRIYFKGYSSSGEEIIYSEDLEIPGVLDPQSELLYIGRSSLRENLEESYFRGAIDEIHIYSRCLSDLEIETYAFTHTQ